MESPRYVGSRPNKGHTRNSLYEAVAKWCYSGIDQRRASIVEDNVLGDLSSVEYQGIFGWSGIEYLVEFVPLVTVGHDHASGGLVLSVLLGDVNKHPVVSVLFPDVLKG